MADGASTYRSIVKPEVGASEDSWGTKYNAMVELLDKALGAEMFGYLSATITGQAGDNSSNIIAFNTCSPNMGTLFSTSTYLFTAPAAGRFVGFLACAFEGLTDGAGVSRVRLQAVTSGGLTYNNLDLTGAWGSLANANFAMPFDIAVANGETVGFYTLLGGQATKDTDLAGVTKNKTHFSARFIATP